ncbi:hypothetical protein G9A89_020778 [Geosiphon pyriformis]|nr:hypothetical protein G9A89_020778 [Geosiphon pyriformis]
MPSLSTYAVISLGFTITYFFTTLALLMPNWLVFSPPIPWLSTVNYGLFERCSAFTNGCHPFPDQENGDCDEKYFCDKWIAARLGMIFATIVGGLTWLFLLLVLVSGRQRREKSWVLASMLMMFHAVFQFLAIGLIAHLFTTTTRFLFATKYDFSFIFANISASISVLLSITLLMNGLLAPPEYIALA